MAIEISIPRLGWNMDEGVFAGWLKEDGETVRAGDPLFSLEGEKATQDTQTELRTIGAASPIFQMIAGVDTPDGAVCGIDGVCAVPDTSSTSSTTK